MTARRPFTPAEDQYILQHYATMLLKDMAQHLGRDWKVVQQRCQILAHKGLLDRRERAYQRPWTQDEIDYLSDNWGLLPDKAVARHLKRTVTACIIAAQRHAKVSRKMAFWTAHNVAELFGVDDHAVIRWIGAGVLQGRKSSVRCGDGHYAWQVDDQAIQAFIRQYPYHYDRSRLERGSFWRKLAEQAWRRDPYLTADEAAAELGVAVWTVHRHLRRGWLRGVKTWEAGRSGGWRIARSELQNFRLKKEPITVSAALQAWYDRGKAELPEKRRATR